MLEDSCERDAETESTLLNESVKEQKTPPRFMETYAEVFSIVSLQGVSGSPERAFLVFYRRALLYRMPTGIRLSLFSMISSRFRDSSPL